MALAALSRRVSLHPDTGVGPVHLRVNDVELASRFYSRMLGLRAEKGESGEMVFSAGQRPLVALEEAPDAPPRDERTTGLYHFALLLPSRAELGRLLQNLVKTQWPLSGLVDHTISEAIYLNDPEGNGIELAADYPREAWATWSQLNPQTMNRPLDTRRMMREAEEVGKAWDGIAPATRMGHVHLHVRDVDEALEFYRDVIEFDVQLRMPSAAFISAGGYHHHLGLNTWAGPRPPTAGAVGLRHFTIEFPTVEERDRILAKVGATDGPFVTDPSGNRALLSVR